MKKIILGAILLMTIATTMQARIACRMFSSQAAAQEYFEARKYQWYLLDRDKDGIACEHLR